MTLFDLQRVAYSLRYCTPGSPAYPSMQEVAAALLDAERGWGHLNDEFSMLTLEFQELSHRHHGAVTAICQEYESAGRYAEMERADPSLGHRWRAYQDGLRAARDTLTGHPDGLSPMQPSEANTEPVAP